VKDDVARCPCGCIYGEHDARAERLERDTIPAPPLPMNVVSLRPPAVMPQRSLEDLCGAELQTALFRCRHGTVQRIYFEHAAEGLLCANCGASRSLTPGSPWRLPRALAEFVKRGAT
jgi:hypothetical protein